MYICRREDASEKDKNKDQSNYHYSRSPKPVKTVNLLLWTRIQFKTTHDRMLPLGMRGKYIVLERNIKRGIFVEQKKQFKNKMK